MFNLVVLMEEHVQLCAMSVAKGVRQLLHTCVGRKLLFRIKKNIYIT